MKIPRLSKKMLCGTAVCLAVGAVLLFPGSIVMLVVGAVLGVKGRDWLRQEMGKEAI